MNIEDLIFSLQYSHINLNAWDSKLMNSFYDQISRGSGLTEKQSVLAIKILTRHSEALSKVHGKDITGFLTNPVFRLPIRKVSSEKKVEISENSQLGRCIKAVFPYNEKIVEKIRQSRDQLGNAFWDKDEKCWFFALNESSIQFLMEIAGQENFEIDNLFQNYAKQIVEIHSNMEKYVPMLVVEEKIPKLRNLQKNMPELSTTDLLTSIFEARKRGIFTWDDTINNFIDSDMVTPITRDFLKNEPGQKFAVNSENYEISVLEDIVKHLFPVLIVIPGGNEFNTLVQSYEFFNSLGISQKDMSVMFRLPSETHEIFNNFVKSSQLNSPISENTKIVFISGKMPKPVLKSKIKFHLVINLGYDNVHYSLRDFVGKHENLVFYSKEKDIRMYTREFV